MNVAACARRLTPIRMLVFLKNSAGTHNILEVSLPAMAALIGRQTIQHSLVCGLLQLDVKRGIDAQTTFMYFITSIFLFQITPHFLDEIGGDGIFCRLDVQDDGRGFGAIGDRFASVIRIAGIEQPTTESEVVAAAAAIGEEAIVADAMEAVR